MVIFAVIAFGLFIAGFLVFVAANAGRGQDDWKRLMETDLDSKRNLSAGNYVAADGTRADGSFVGEDMRMDPDDPSLSAPMDPFMDEFSSGDTSSVTESGSGS